MAVAGEPLAGTFSPYVGRHLISGKDLIPAICFLGTGLPFSFEKYTPYQALYDIRYFEYSSISSPFMHDALRQFKADFFQALAHPTRIAILEQLRDSELSAGALIERLGIEQANAS
jgi:hypothetical protein